MKVINLQSVHIMYINHDVILKFLKYDCLLIFSNAQNHVNYSILHTLPKEQCV